MNALTLTQQHAAMLAALRAIVHQRDYFADHGAYDMTQPRPDPDQGFDDWSADIAATVIAQVRS